MRAIDFRVDAIRDGAPFTQLRFSDAPTIYCDGDADLHLSLRGSFKSDDNVDLLRDELQPVIIVDGVDFPMGAFRVATAREIIQNGASTWSVEAFDRGILLEWAKLESKAYFASGTGYETIINRYLTAAGITRTSFTPTGLTLASAREWDIGTSYLQIVNELLQELSYDKLWFDSRGFAILRPYQAPSVSNISHTYGKQAPGGAFQRITPEASRETDVFSKPNVWVVVRTSPDYTTALTATAVNENPASPLSTVRRGIRVPEIVRVDNIASQESLQSYANKLRDRGMESSETLSISTAIQPTHGVGDVVAITEDPLTGLYRESGWTITMQAGSYMTHTLERTVLTSDG